MNLRSALRRIAHELGLKGYYTHDDVIKELRSRHPSLIAAESQRLETIALKRILSDVDAKQAKTYNAEQGEFFPELAGFPGSYDARTVGLTDQKGVRVLLQLLPVKVVRAIANYAKPPKKNSSPQGRLKSYLEELSSHIQSDAEMFGEVIKRSRKK
ncbi:hypothetical protein HFN80_19425 [Rhizobium laguerreae]|uniref:hypothetical protein n=1 Tax=Rhizobium laguerreae TaxID=1076926 RepID=UPI001C8FD7C9|nr:hypothetical protein [Rhizobium laguerreae]MBY3466136.1 hypothetical protein [Rhizobium laguerreae]